LRRVRLSFSFAVVGLAIASLYPTVGVGAEAASFPSGYEGYHDYGEMVAELDAIVAGKPKIARKVSIGQSYEGRTIWALKISDRVASDENEPEVLMDALHHAREHLTVEMALHVARLLTDNFKQPGVLGQRVTDIVKSREIWIVPMLNPDGGEYDISDPSGEFLGWRRNRQPIPGASPIGVDLNRNWGFKWGCCGGSSGTPGASTYRGPSPWFSPEVKALRDFVLKRVKNGRQQIRAAISWHTWNEQIMWPYGYTTQDVPRTMTPDDHDALSALGHDMADLNGYIPQQLSDLYLLDGGASDWLYGVQRIFAYTVEMYPRAGSGSGTAGFYPPDSVIHSQTSRNDEMVLHFLELADCPYRAAGLGVTHCGPLNDDFEISRGWKINPTGTDSATNGKWQRAQAQETSTSAGTKQHAYGYTGSMSLVTAAAAGASAAAKDVDGGVTSVRSAQIKLGSSGSSGWTLAFQYAFAHDETAQASDFLRISINGTTLFQQTADGSDRDATWTQATVDLDAFAGQTVRLLVEAADNGTDSLVEAAIDDVRVYQEP
jgi:hypothetical protein